MEEIEQIEQKYYGMEGLLAFQLWNFAICIKSLQLNQHRLEKANTLYALMVNFSQSVWYKRFASSENIGDFNALLNMADIIRHSS